MVVGSRASVGNSVGAAIFRIDGRVLTACVRIQGKLLGFGWHEVKLAHQIGHCRIVGPESGFRLLCEKMKRLDKFLANH